MAISEDTAWGLLDSAANMARALHETIAREAGPTLPKALVAVLFTMARRGPARPSVLANDLFIGQPALSRHLAELSEYGYITRSDDPEDGRATVVSLTPKGREYVNETRVLRVAKVRELLKEWDEDSAREAMDVLRHLSTSLAPQIVSSVK